MTPVVFAMMTALFGAAAVSPPTAAAKEPAQFAIVIGVNVSDSPGVSTLRYADDDAVATHRLLVQAGVESKLLVSLDEDSRRLYPDLVPDGAPKLERVMAVFENLCAKMRKVADSGRDTEFLLFYSGHGNVEHGEGYVVLDNSRLTRRDLYESILSRSSAGHNHVIVDACKSYFLAFDKGPGGVRAPYPHPFVDRADAVKFKHTGFVLSTSSDRDSHEWERYQAGIFSHEIRSALRGGADVNRDGRITYAELGAFLNTANQAIANPRYRPDFVIRPPGTPPGDLSQEVLCWREQSNALLLDQTAWGHVYLENARGERLLDVHPAKEEQFVLQLPPERPLFLRKADESTEVIVEERGVVRLSMLQFRSVLVARKGALRLAFESLFTEPFGSEDVAAFEDSYCKAGDTVGVLTVEAEVPARTGVTIKKVAQWTVIGAAALGVSMNLWALERYDTGKNASQARRARLNTEIGRFNTAARVFYALAGVAAVTWLTFTIWPGEDDSQGLGVTVVPQPGPEVVGFGLLIELGP
jgi:hypothetical protein